MKVGLYNKSVFTDPDPHPVLFWPLDPASRIPNPYFKELNNFLGLILGQLAQIFFLHTCSKIKIILNFLKFMATKKLRQLIFPLLFFCCCWIQDLGSGLGKNLDLWYATLIVTFATNQWWWVIVVSLFARSPGGWKAWSYWHSVTGPEAGQKDQVLEEGKDFERTLTIINNYDYLSLKYGYFPTCTDTLFFLYFLG